MKPVKICFFGLFGQGNLGNECTLQAVLYHARLRFPDGRFTCVCTGPEDTSRRHGIPAGLISRRYACNGAEPVPAAGVRPLARMFRALSRLGTEALDWLTTFRTLRGKHFLVVPGTGILHDAYTTAFGWPLDLFRWSLVARLCGCRLVYVGVGGGPFYRPLSRWFIKAALSLADFRSFRNVSTLEALRKIGFSRADDAVCPDLAFSLPEAVLPRRPERLGQRRRVGLGLMRDAGRLSSEKLRPDAETEYLQALVTFAAWLLERDYDVRLLIGDFAYDPAVTAEFKRRLKERVPGYDQGRILDDSVTSVEDLLAQVAGCDVVVATRFHNLILAMLLGKPVISVAFHHKCVSLMESMGLAEYCLDIHALEATRLIDLFEQLERNMDWLGATIVQRGEEYRRILHEQYERIFGDRLIRAEPARTS
jgi:polysaccharide pyruvyl transferase WcaK-like protein